MSARPGAARTLRTCLGCRWTSARSARHSTPERQDLPAVDVPDPDLRLLRLDPPPALPRPRQRPGAVRLRRPPRHRLTAALDTARPRHLRLPPRRTRCPALRQRRRPIHPEPATLRRIQGPVLRRGRAAEATGTAPARRRTRHHPARDRPPGPRRHLSPSLVARPRQAAVRGRHGPGTAGVGRAGRTVPRPGHGRPAAHLG